MTGVLLVGGASRRFGSPKALARLGGQTLAERAWELLGEVCDERLAVGKATEAGALPFPVRDDGVDVRAPIAGLVAGLRAAPTELVLALPVDCPLLEAGDLRALVAACAGDAAVPQTGPLPGAYRRSALAALERALVDRRLAIREALVGLDVAVVILDAARLANVEHARRARGPRAPRAIVSVVRGAYPRPARARRRKELGMAGGLARRRGGMNIGGGVVVAGIVIALFWSFWIGLLIVLVGLIAFGGFVRGKWY